MRHPCFNPISFLKGVDNKSSVSKGSHHGRQFQFRNTPINLWLRGLVAGDIHLNTVILVLFWLRLETDRPQMFGEIGRQLCQRFVRLQRRVVQHVA